MYSVYKITNLTNNKSYIGSSIRVEKRWREHISCSQRINDEKYNYPLYRAFRKYGVENFSFEVLKDDFSSIEEMQEYEKEMILFYDSYNYGYNQTLNTNSNNIANENLQKHLEKVSCKCAKIDKQGNILEKYKSYHDAARKNGMDGDQSATKIRNVCKGITSSINDDLIFRDLDENEEIIFQSFKSYKGRKPIIGIRLSDGEEIYFNSILEASRLLPADRRSIGLCVQGNQRHSNVKGYVFRQLDLDGNIIEVENTIENIQQEYDRTNPVINGERHNITEWCKIYGISKESVYTRIKKGMTLIEAITTPKRR